MLDNVSVLTIKSDSEYQEVYVFRYWEDVEEIYNECNNEWLNSDGEKSFYEIITEKYGDKLLSVSNEYVAYEF